MIHVTCLDRRLLEKAVDRIVREAKSRNEEVRSAQSIPCERRRIVRMAR